MGEETWWRLWTEGQHADILTKASQTLSRRLRRQYHEGLADILTKASGSESLYKHRENILGTMCFPRFWLMLVLSRLVIRYGTTEGVRYRFVSPNSQITGVTYGV